MLLHASRDSNQEPMSFTASAEQIASTVFSTRSCTPRSSARDRLACMRLFAKQTVLWDSVEPRRGITIRPRLPSVVHPSGRITKCIDAQKLNDDRVSHLQHGTTTPRTIDFQDFQGLRQSHPTPPGNAISSLGLATQLNKLTLRLLFVDLLGWHHDDRVCRAQPISMAVQRHPVQLQPPGLRGEHVGEVAERHARGHEAGGGQELVAFALAICIPGYVRTCQ
jgi:hypothetical protein